MGRRDHIWISERAAQLSNLPVPERLEIITDTTEFMNIHPGHVLKVGGNHFFVTGNIYEVRFGIGDEPKYWVKKAVHLETGAQQIVKLVYFEEFIVRVGPLRVRCYRKPSKESRVLDLVIGHPGFMQGRGLFDQKGNEIRSVDYIRGKSLYNMIFGLNLSHEEYFHTMFPRILRNLRDCFSAIQFLHDHDLCHGDIRNDHILIDQESGNYRWIDFDLTQDFSDFDVWSLGNVLQFCVGMGMRTFHDVLKDSSIPENIRNRLTSDDASAFYGHRIMNLKKLFSYIPERINDILLHFAANTTRFYESAGQVVSDVGEALEDLQAGSVTEA